MEQTTYLKINPADSVVVCLEAKKKGAIIEVDGQQIILNQDTPAGTPLHHLQLEGSHRR